MSNDFKFGSKSFNNLTGVDKELRMVVAVALTLSEVDFSVVCGMRTIEEQRELVRTGKSQTMHSKHLVGEAVDILPVRGYTYHSDFFKMIDAVGRASEITGVPIVWGGCWTKLNPSISAQEANRIYNRAKAALNERGFNDLCHIQLA